MTAMVELKNVTKTIKGKKIIDDLSFEVNHGEVFGFLGPNGAGKTTTIRMIVGLIGITEGDILINGKSVQRDFADAMKDVGAIVENPELYKFLTGYQNLMQFVRMTKGVTKERIDEVVELVDLKDNIHKKVKTYSLGMRQRLGLAQCLLHQPKVLILDEPTNGLDPAGIREMRDHLRKLAKEENMCIIVSSHLLSEMEMMCDRIAIISKGKLVNVQNVHEQMEENERSYLFEIDKLEEAISLLEGKGYSVLKEQDGLVVSTNREGIPFIIKLMVEKDINMYGIKEVKRTLEERFLEITAN
ncbi:ABC transporter ATP-binding protein [Bacillus carboniphilus]|uniref:ABC transporter ATP-binding protein n=1 Tax=Bacillus carboniphilus TaxID=86663 RepID=A0ABY9JXN3_9BACI|nr:ABC transporter ATP-binding protein [Bacillus carboniphilus]WLR42421.1 ABC transporter ATP-binding protein [Bacillus carboniphilus]